jgi:hypothetical protein
MSKCVRLMPPPVALGRNRRACPKTMREARLCVMLNEFLATLKYHECEALAYLASSLITPIQPATLVTTPVFDTF